MTPDQWARHINNALPLVGAADDIPLAGATLPLAGAALPLAGSIRINGRNLHCDICLNLVLNLDDLDEKKILREFITTRLSHRLDHQYIATRFLIRGDRGTMPFRSRATLGQSVCLIPRRNCMG